MMKKKLVAFLYDVLSVVLTATGLAYSSGACRRLLRKAEEQPVDVIIVPGVPFRNGRWDTIMKGRVYWAKYLYEKGLARNVIFSGAAVYSPYKEGEIMAMYAEAIGIPAGHIYQELLAEHSTENIYYSYKLARKLGFCSMALASDPFQTKMLRRFTAKYVSTEIVMLPLVYGVLRKMDKEMTDPPIDHEKALVRDFVSIKDRAGFHRRFKGTRGKDIKPGIYD